MAQIVNSEFFGGHGKRDKTGKIIEFGSFQGEGQYTGITAEFWRLGNCNLRCRGFGNIDLNNPNSWVKEFEGIDVTQFKDVNSVPIVKTGCDTPYASDPKFKHLLEHLTPVQVTERMREWLVDGKFIHPKTKQDCHLVISGGEPMLQQKGIVEVFQQLEVEENMPLHITMESNGTVPLHKTFSNWYNDYVIRKIQNFELFWSISPKLSPSGEKWETAIKPAIVGKYAELSKEGQLKYVSDGTDRAWDEIEKATELYRNAGVNFPVWIMPMGSYNEDLAEIQAKIADECMNRGYNFSARVHVLIYGNKPGK